MKDVMVDIETLDNMPGASILQIAAVRFDRDTGETSADTFSVNVSLNSCLEAGLTVNQDTFKWWMHQDDQARKSLFDPAPVSLASALNAFSRFLTKEDRIWCHECFDIPCLDVAFRRSNIGVPWNYRLVRDLRTYFEDRNFDPKTDTPSLPTEVLHNASSDCHRQIRQMKAAKDRAGF